MDSGKSFQMTQQLSRRHVMKARQHPAIVKRPCQLSMTLETPELTQMNTAERQAMVLRLAQLILQAGGMRIMEASDDER